MKFEKLLKKLTFYSEHHTHQISCVIAKGNKILSAGVNKIKTHPSSNHPWKMTHAELDAILGCNREDLVGADLYLFRQNKNGKLACSKPCKYCQELIRLSGIKRVIYTNEGSYKEEKLA
jgi:deoxycytidylate deaminase